MNKKAKRKLTLALAIVSLVVFFGGQFYLVMNPQPGSPAAQGYSFVRDSPAWQFYGFMGLLSIPFLIVLYITFNQKRWSQLATSGSIRNAKKVALSLWYVEGTMAETKRELERTMETARNLGYLGRLHRLEEDEDDFAVVRFSHMSFGRRKFTLPVRPGHPDIDKFRQLKTGDTVEFEALSEGMDCALEHELCGFLRIKSIS